MNEKEKQIIDLIKENPYITQQDIAEQLSLSRSGVAGYISSLTKNGYIVGRAYVLKEERKLLCIGGANLDRKATAKTSLKLNDSNPVHVRDSLGGVARNIAENLARLELPVSLLTVVGNDTEGEKVVKESGRRVDLTPTVRLPGQRTGTYTAVLDNCGEMLVALADMDIYDQIEELHLKEKLAQIRSADFIVMDLNFPKHITSFIFKECKKHAIPLGIVPVSANKIDRMPDHVHGLSYFVCNEVEIIDYVKRVTNKQTLSVQEAMEIAVNECGIKHVIVTNGADDVKYQMFNGESGTATPYKANVKDVTGAGDAFSAGLFYGLFQEKVINEALQFGLAAAKMTLETDSTVNEQLTAKSLVNTFQQS
ncbi:carbohydrate kinase [Evansella halocellulosilytica]|uniref:carbohydrate kinase n=1 Tax=Evansella halocellulosilytica TaxID=2011013 RepID=UPI000BB926DA|nr:carbohydrate kinase [Evansella halocellulosilytica]